jgi:hypothetical protein
VRLSSAWPGRTASVYAAILGYMVVWSYLVNGSYGMERVAIEHDYPLEWKVIPLVLLGMNCVGLGIAVLAGVRVLTRRLSRARFLLLLGVSLGVLLVMNTGGWLVGALATLRYDAPYLSPQP